MFEIIVVAVDGSDASDHALLTACDMAKKYNSKLHVVHSPQLETTVVAAGHAAIAIPPDPEKVEEAGRIVIEKATKMAKAQGTEIAKSIIGEGDPAMAILKEIEASDADLVVMGRRGLGRVSSLLLGSVSQKVCHDAGCTCMTVC